MTPEEIEAILQGLQVGDVRGFDAHVLRAAFADVVARAEAAEAQAKQSAEAHDFLAHQVGAAAIAATLAPGESLAHKPGETPLFIVGVVERLVARTHAAESTAARLNAANVRLMRRLAVALGVWRGSADSLAAMGRRAKAAEAALATARAEGAEAERAAVVAWLRRTAVDISPTGLPDGEMTCITDDIEEGRHARPVEAP